MLVLVLWGGQEMLLNMFDAAVKHQQQQLIPAVPNTHTLLGCNCSDCAAGMQCQ